MLCCNLPPGPEALNARHSRCVRAILWAPMGGSTSIRRLTNTAGTPLWSWAWDNVPTAKMNLHSRFLGPTCAHGDWVHTPLHFTPRQPQRLHVSRKLIALVISKVNPKISQCCLKISSKISSSMPQNYPLGSKCVVCVSVSVGCVIPPKARAGTHEHSVISKVHESK